MKTALSRLASRIASFLPRRRRRRYDHPDAHRAYGTDQYDGLYKHYTPSSSGGGKPLL
ncbi:hypothetical protein AB0G60_09930 [Streptomyces angustmyceticus]|uniref:Uncharacterized protein n=1 Tax=Streptomyces angustmyceticus TaxID=285578 RepID=A0A5J4LED1_9ACTN|nr:hypothetical protein [Streptomyces angustmyceticus]UAL70801.1 hypothetical protein K7396_33050 [Streptomyces angustmyceticus]GES29870.1 hypothetical protein San01_23570 [Streptomyces angustmyceticus]